MVVIFKRVTDKDMSSSPPLSLSLSISTSMHWHCTRLARQELWTPSPKEQLCCWLTMLVPNVQMPNDVAASLHHPKRLHPWATCGEQRAMENLALLGTKGTIQRSAGEPNPKQWGRHVSTCFKTAWAYQSIALTNCGSNHTRPDGKTKRWQQSIIDVHVPEELKQKNKSITNIYQGSWIGGVPLDFRLLLTD